MIQETEHYRCNISDIFYNTQSKLLLYKSASIIYELLIFSNIPIKNQ